MMAFVFGVIAASIFDGSMHLVLGSQSTNTAVAPAIQIASAVAKNVFGCVMTSSPGPMPIAISASQIASVPLPDADGVRHPVKRGQLLFELLEHGALHVLAALDHALQVRVYLRLNVLVLPHVSVKADLHHHLHGLRLPQKIRIASLHPFGGDALHSPISTSVPEKGEVSKGTAGTMVGPEVATPPPCAGAGPGLQSVRWSPGTIVESTVRGLTAFKFASWPQPTFALGSERPQWQRLSMT